MIIVKCVICKKKAIRFINKNENLTLGLQEDWDLIYKHQCKNCNQTTVRIKYKNTNKINSLWLEYYINNKLIQKKISTIKKEIETLNDYKKKSRTMTRKFNDLTKSFEDSKTKKDSLKHTMLASISVQLGTLL